MQKFENMDVIAALEAIMHQNTAYYQSDFAYDIYALVGKNENRDKGICKPRTSVRKQLSETKQAASPKKAAARSKQHEMEV